MILVTMVYLISLIHLSRKPTPKILKIHRMNKSYQRATLGKMMMKFLISKIMKTMTIINKINSKNKRTKGKKLMIMALNKKYKVINNSQMGQ